MDIGGSRDRRALLGPEGNANTSCQKHIYIGITGPGYAGKEEGHHLISYVSIFVLIH